MTVIQHLHHAEQMECHRRNFQSQFEPIRQWFKQHGQSESEIAELEARHWKIFMLKAGIKEIK
jgi:hypothetical protein